MLASREHFGGFGERERSHGRRAIARCRQYVRKASAELAPGLGPRYTRAVGFARGSCGMGRKAHEAPRHADARLVKRLLLAIICAVFAGLALPVVSDSFRQLRTSQPHNPHPVSIYDAMPVPGTSSVMGSPGAAGADFSQVYTSALALRHGESAYHPKTEAFRDRFGRPAGYPPLMNWLYVPITWLPYDAALLAHVLVSLAALFGVSAWALSAAGLARQIPLLLLAQACLFFLTPIGVTHLERGQFDLHVAAVIGLCFACTFLDRSLVRAAVTAGIAGALKWTALPFLGCYSALGFVASSGLRRWAFFIMPALTFLATAVFWKGVADYWYTIQVFEIDAQTYGLTLQHFMPRAVAKAAPVVVTLAFGVWVLLRARSSGERITSFRSVSAPFALGLTNLGVCFGTLSYEYHTVTTLGMLPGLVVWTCRTDDVAAWVKSFVCGAFGVFVVVAFRTFDPVFKPAPEAATMSGWYVLFALVFFSISGHVLWSRRRAPAAVQAAA